MTREEVARLAALAGHLGCTPRELLVAAARGVDEPAGERRNLADRLRLQAGPAEAVESCANLLLTPPGSYAMDELDTLLASIWRTGEH